MKIYCDKCNEAVAETIGNSMIEIIGDGSMQALGKDYNLIFPCKKCGNKIFIPVENGKVLTDNLNTVGKKDEEKKNDDQNEENPEGGKPEGEGDGDKGKDDNGRKYTEV